MYSHHYSIQKLTKMLTSHKTMHIMENVGMKIESFSLWKIIDAKFTKKNEDLSFVLHIFAVRISDFKNNPLHLTGNGVLHFSKQYKTTY